jgi:hypothetical protein
MKLTSNIHFMRRAEMREIYTTTLPVGLHAMALAQKENIPSA